jgi:hypothetical protein
MWKPGPYEPDFASRALELGRRGATRVGLAEGLDASLEDLEAWAHDHDDFAIALADANRLARSEWERRPIEALATGKPFQVAAWARLYTTLFGRAAVVPIRPDTRSRARTSQVEPDDEVVVRFNIPDNGRRRRTRKGETQAEGD